MNKNGINSVTMNIFDRDYFKDGRAFKFKHYRLDGKYLNSGLLIVANYSPLGLKVYLFPHTGGGTVEFSTYMKDISIENFETTWKLEPLFDEEDSEE